MKWQLTGVDAAAAISPDALAAHDLDHASGIEAEIDKYLALKTAIHRKLLDRISPPAEPFFSVIDLLAKAGKAHCHRPVRVAGHHFEHQFRL